MTMKTLRLRIAAAMAGLLALQALLLPASAAAPLQAPPDSVSAHAVDAADEDTVDVVPACITVCDRTAEVLAVKLASPL